MKRSTISLVIISAGLALAGCTILRPNVSTNESADTVVVGTSFYVLEEFARQVGGEYVTLITPPGSSGGHSYSPAPQDVATILASDMFVYQGTSFDPWAQKLVSDFQDQDKPVIAVTDYLELRATGHEDNADDEAEVEDGAYDPHTWTDPLQAIHMVEVIRDKLNEIDPAHADDYSANAASYISELEALDTEYAHDLANCSQDTVIVAHDAFGYMADRYGFQIESIAGFSPDSVPSANHLAELTELMKAQGIEYVLFETLTTPDVAESLASDAGAKTLVLNPLEGLTTEERQAGEDYISIMRKNLTTLQTALNCQ